MGKREDDIWNSALKEGKEFRYISKLAIAKLGRELIRGLSNTHRFVNCVSLADAQIVAEKIDGVKELMARIQKL